MTNWRRAAALVGVVMLTSSRARADAPTPETQVQVAEARAHFTRGVKFYQDADYRSALVEFQEAYRLAPNPRLLFNIGQTYEELQDFAGAVKSLREYLEQSGTSITQQRRDEVARDLRSLERRVATVEITVSEAGADVVIEGDRRVELGKSPLAGPVLVNGGKWTVVATKPGFGRAEERLTAAGGDSKKVTLTLEPEKEAPPLASDSAAPSGPQPRAFTRVYVALAVTGGFAVAAGVTGLLALSGQSDYDRAVARLPGDADEISRARSKTQTFALATDIFAGAAIVGAVTTVVLRVTAHSRSAAGRPAGASNAVAGPTGVDVHLQVGPGGVGATGSF